MPTPDHGRAIGCNLLRSSTAAGTIFELWQVAGQERYRSLAPMYYRGAAAGLIFYEAGKREDYERAKSWIRELRRQGDPTMVLALVEAHYDPLNQLGLPRHEVQEYAESHGAFFHELLVSSTPQVQELFSNITARLDIGCVWDGLDVGLLRQYAQ